MIILILLWRLGLWMLLDDLPETIVIGINQRNNRMEDCRYNKDNGLPSEKELLLNLLENYCPTLKKNTVPHRLELLPDMIQQQGF
jgi:hypothetical protein